MTTAGELAAEEGQDQQQLAEQLWAQAKEQGWSWSPERAVEPAHQTRSGDRARGGDGRASRLRPARPAGCSPALAHREIGSPRATESDPPLDFDGCRIGTRSVKPSSIEWAPPPDRPTPRFRVQTRNRRIAISSSSRY